MSVKMHETPWTPAREIIAQIADCLFCLKEKCKFLGSIDGLWHSSSKVKRSLNLLMRYFQTYSHFGRLLWSEWSCSCRRQGHGGPCHACRRSCCCCYNVSSQGVFHLVDGCIYIYIVCPIPYSMYLLSMVPIQYDCSRTVELDMT